MKLQCLITSSVFALALSANAAVLQGGSLINGDGTIPDTVILGAGGPLASGYYGVGFFTGLDDAQIALAVTSGDFTALNGAWREIAADDFITGVPNLIGIAAIPGMTSVGNPGFDPTAGIGSTLYTYMTDGAALGNTGAYALYRHSGLVIAADPASPPPASYTTVLSSGELLAGAFTGPQVVNSPDLGGDVTMNESITLIPEPSALLLGLVGFVGLLRRRR